MNSAQYTPLLPNMQGADEGRFMAPKFYGILLIDMPKERVLASSETLAEIMATAAVAGGIAAFDQKVSLRTRARSSGLGVDMFVDRLDDDAHCWDYRIVSSFYRVRVDRLHPRPLPRLVWLLEQRVYGDYAPLKHQVDEDMTRYEPKAPEDMTDGQDVVGSALAAMKCVLDAKNRIVRVHAYRLEAAQASIICEEGVRYGSEKDETDVALESHMLTGSAVDFTPERAEMWASRLASFAIQDSGILRP